MFHAKCPFHAWDDKQNCSGKAKIKRKFWCNELCKGGNSSASSYVLLQIHQKNIKNKPTENLEDDFKSGSKGISF